MTDYYDWYPGTLPDVTPWQPPPEEAPGPQVKARTPRCWLCGRFVHRPRYVMTRECPQCAVRWVEPTPEEAEVRMTARARELRGILKNYRITEYIDHASVHVPCPA